MLARLALAAALAVPLAPPPASAQPAPTGQPTAEPTVQKSRPHPLSAGRVRFALGAGGSTTFTGHSAFGAALGVGYFVIDGLEVGADTSLLFSDGPFLAHVSPQVRYAFDTKTPVLPYVGAFYRHFFVGDGLPDLDALGARAGLFVLSGGAFFGLGLGWQTLLNHCDGDDCTSLFPELTFSFVF